MTMTAADTTRHSDGQSNQMPAPPAMPRDGVVARDSAAPWGQADARLARTGLALRRLRYFHALLTGGFTASQSADLPSGTMRSERIALAIDRPELDAVSLWAARRDDGAVAIPFVEYLLGQFVVSLEMFLADLADPGAAAEVATLSTALEMALKETNRRGDQALVVPQLGDSFLPGPLLERVCGREGLLDRTLQRCEGLLGEAH
jgi:hypothetical protein